MKTKNTAALVLALLIAAPVGLTGCFMKRFAKNKAKGAPPQILVFPFLCDRPIIGEKINKGFISGLDKKVERLDLNKFKLWLASYSLSMDLYLPVKFTGDPYDPQMFLKEIFQKPEIRKEFYSDTGIEYVVIGKAKEKKLVELETGNLETAEKAEMKMLDFENGIVLLDEKFKQGLIEVVSPERIGSKFVSKVNKKLKGLRKQQKRKLKEEKKRLKEL